MGLLSPLAHEDRYAGVMTTVVTNAGLQETARVTAAPGVGTISRTVSGRDASLRETAWSVGGIELDRSYRPSDGKFASLTAASGTLQFDYDISGRKSSESGSLALAGDMGAAYTYTSAGRLESDTASGSATYVFDAAGNIATETVGADVRDYDYDAGNRLDSLTQGADTTSFGWDEAHGWRTSARASGETSVTFSYTGTGRLAHYSDPNRDIEAEYAYDAAGQRVSSTVTSGSVTTATSCLYEGLSLLSLCATESVGAVESTYSVTYLHDGSGTPYAGVFASSEASPVAFAITTTDWGDVVELCDMGGAPFAAYRYDAWGLHRAGECTTTCTTVIDANTAERIARTQPLRYAGYCFDEHSGLYYLSARSYDPATRQFLTKDPAKSDGEESAYQYCGGDPVMRQDPSGCVYVVSSALSYARTWWNTYGGNRPMRSFPYYRKGDCANFVSQCLFAGGHTMCTTWKAGTILGVKMATPTWRQAHRLYMFLALSGRAKHIARIDNLSNKSYWLACALPGDVLCYDFGKNGYGSVDHLSLVTYSDRSHGTLKAQHTFDTYTGDWRGRNRAGNARTRMYVLRPR